MQTFSLLDLSPISEGKTAADALANTTQLAIAAEKSGYNRFWIAEHHNMAGIASAATAVMIGHIAAATSTLGIGAGGIMLPNHAPLIIAEQFGTLATLYPNRIDLGLGRAPGTDQETARALRRNMSANDTFANDVQELIGYFGTASASDKIRAIPGEGTQVPVWILGSSLYGAQLAAHLGLPYAFASHFAPDFLAQAIATYRASFQPSAALAQPYVMMAAGVCAADTDEEAAFLRSSQILSFAHLFSGTASKLPAPVRNVETQIPAHVYARVKQALSVSANGTAETIHAQFQDLIKTYQPDELIVTGMLHDHAARLKSFDIAAKVLTDLKT